MCLFRIKHAFILQTTKTSKTKSGTHVRESSQGAVGSPCTGSLAGDLEVRHLFSDDYTKLNNTGCLRLTQLRDAIRKRHNHRTNTTRTKHNAFGVAAFCKGSNKHVHIFLQNIVILSRSCCHRALGKGYSTRRCRY